MRRPDNDYEINNLLKEQQQWLEECQRKITEGQDQAQRYIQEKAACARRIVALENFLTAGNNIREYEPPVAQDTIQRAKRSGAKLNEDKFGGY